LIETDEFWFIFRRYGSWGFVFYDKKTVKKKVFLFANLSEKGGDGYFSSSSSPNFSLTHKQDFGRAVVVA